MPGPLPKPKAQRRRRNAPTIPTTDLPASGREGPAPKVPSAYKLKGAGRAWWRWAWGLPQAAAWDAGALYAVARRASLEDDLAILEDFDPDALEDVLGMVEADAGRAVRELGYVLGRLKALAGGRVTLMREMRELDNRLGLTPEAMAKLRWKIIADESSEERPAAVRKLRAV